MGMAPQHVHTLGMHGLEDGGSVERRGVEDGGEADAVLGGGEGSHTATDGGADEGGGGGG